MGARARVRTYVCVRLCTVWVSTLWESKCIAVTLLPPTPPPIKYGAVFQGLVTAFSSGSH